MNSRNCGVLILLVALLADWQNTAHADTLDLQTAAQDHPNLIHQWTFDGADEFARRQDKQGTADLDVLVAGSGTAQDIGYGVAGFDASSEAVSTFRQVPGSDHDGTAAFHNNAITLGFATSYEVLVRPDEAIIEGGTWNLGYILATRVDSNRGYFVIQGSAQEIGGTFGVDGDDFSSVIGGSFNVSNEQTIAETMQADHWYYLAGSYTAAADGSSTTFTNYIADLTAGDTTLTTVGPRTVTGTYPTGPTPLGIGNRWDAGEAFPGTIDEVNFYDAALDAPVFQAHLDALTKAALQSDLTGNGFVDFEDLTVLLANWNKDVTVAGGNLVEPLTTVVNFDDLTVLLADWTGPGPAGSPEAAWGDNAVPEPSTLLLALFATFGLIASRRRRRRAT